MINVSGTSGEKKEEEKDNSSWFQDQEDDLAVEFVAVSLVGLHCVLLLIFCCQSKNMYNL